MKKLIAILALGIAALGFSGAALAQDTAASAPAATASAAEPAASAAAEAAPADAASAPAAAAPVANKGDVAWMIVATLLVVMMTVPGLALFYGGLVRSKNILSVLMQVMVTFSLIVVLWAIYGYSLAFTEGNAYVGGFDRLFLKGLFDPAAGTFAMGATFSKGVYIPELLFAAFQATFAGITCCLIVGAFAERIKFSAVLLFSARCRRSSAHRWRPCCANCAPRTMPKRKSHGASVRDRWPLTGAPSQPMRATRRMRCARAQSTTRPSGEQR